MVLPDTEDVRGEFGTIAWTGRKDAELQAQRRYAWQRRLWYDVLNRVAPDATLGQANGYEVDLAVGHLPHTSAGDLLVRQTATSRPAGCLRS